MVDTDDVQPVAQPEAVVGIDLGVTTLATLSTGEVIEGPKSHKAALKRLRRANKAHGAQAAWLPQLPEGQGPAGPRCTRASPTIRRDATHKLTTDRPRHIAVIGIEDLNVRGMVRNRHLARAVSDGGFHEFRRQIDIQGAAVWRARRGRRPLVSLKQVLLLLRRHQGDAGLGGKDVPLH